LAKFNKREAVDCLCGNFYDMTQEERERECVRIYSPTSIKTIQRQIQTMAACQKGTTIIAGHLWW